MSWQPDTEWKTVKKPLTKDDLDRAMEGATEPYRENLRRFISMIQPDDELWEIHEGNNNRGHSYYLGYGTEINHNNVRVTSGISYKMITGTRMS